MALDFSISLLSTIVSGGIALGSFLKINHSVARRCFAMGLAVLALESFFSGQAARSITADQELVWETRAFGALAMLPCIWLAFSLTYARGNGAELLKKWRWWLWAMLVLPIGCCVLFWGQLLSVVAQPPGAWTLHVRPAGLVLDILFLLASILVLMNLETTFRAAVGTMRWRIKFMVLGLAVLFAVRSYSATQMLLFRTVSLTRNEINSAALLISGLVVLRSLFRAGHFELSVYPSPSLLYNSVTLFLAGVYLIVVGILAKVVAFLGGDSSFELKSLLVLVALVLLAALLLSDHVRLYTKRFASRHFQRPMYDYRTIWRVFTEGMTARVEPADMCNAVVKVVSDLFQALSVTIWLIDESKEKLSLGASTSFSQTDSGNPCLTPEETKHLVSALSSAPEPTDIDSSTEPWAAFLRRSHPGEFARGGNRVCIAMKAEEELQGILILGDRVGGAPFSLQDFELLKCISNQAAAVLLNIRLAQRLSLLKQFEGFQAMSAFFVHDLKNTASTLSLMLQNLPVHYQDPQFRQDALRGISKTIDHINDLVSRLTILRHGLELHPVDCELNELISQSLQGLEQVSGIKLELELAKLPGVRLDPQQIEKVLTNLVLNAREAMPGGGKIRLRTSQEDGCAVVTVSDTGCGMSPEFIQRSLFRPFSTTKKGGIGIGLFHCKMIVEAHHGRIEVESEVGKGTTFRLKLPVAPLSGRT